MKKNKKEDDEEIRRGKGQYTHGIYYCSYSHCLACGHCLCNGGAYERHHILSGHGHLGDTGYRHIKQADIKLT